MNYQLIYDNIITRAITESRYKSTNQYFECHHIVPKCIGGSNEKSNLVLLKAREHFIVHWLLIRIYPDNRKLAHAFWAMCNLKGNSLDNRITPSSRTYMEAKEHRSKLGMSEEQKQKLRKPKRDSSKMGKHDKYGIKNPFYGKTHSIEAKQKMRTVIKEKRKKGWLPGNARPVEIDGIQYRCLSEATKKTGIGNSLIIYRIKSNNIKYNSYKYIEN
jgi:hypothetical protein